MVGVVTARGVAVCRVVDDGMPEPMAGSVGATVLLATGVNAEGTMSMVSWGRIEELELRSAGATAPLTSTAPLTALLTATGVGSLAQEACHRSRAI